MNKSKRFGLVLTSTEKRALSRLAEADGGLSLGATVRRLIRQEAQRRGLWTPAVQHQSGMSLTVTAQHCGDEHNG